CETKQVRLGLTPTFWLAAMVCASSTARAGTFDPSGNFTFAADAIVTNGFDDLAAPQQGVKLVRGGDAVQGGAYLNVNTQNSGASFAITLPPRDASYVSRVFARQNRINATISISYSDSGS